MKKNMEIKSSLIDFYLEMKKYSLDINNVKKEDNKEYLSSMDELDLIKYIRDSIDTVILTLVEKKINEINNEYKNESSLII